MHEIYSRVKKEEKIGIPVNTGLEKDVSVYFSKYKKGNSTAV